MYNLEPVLEDEMYKVLWDSEIQKDYQTSIRPSDSPTKKEYLQNGELCRPSRPQIKKKRKRKEKSVPRPCLITKNYGT